MSERPVIAGDLARNAKPSLLLDLGDHNFGGARLMRGEVDQLNPRTRRCACQQIGKSPMLFSLAAVNSTGCRWARPNGRSQIHCPARAFGPRSVTGSAPAAPIIGFSTAKWNGRSHGVKRRSLPGAAAKNSAVANIMSVPTTLASMRGFGAGSKVCSAVDAGALRERRSSARLSRARLLSGRGGDKRKGYVGL